LPTLFIAFSAAAMVYVVGNIVSLEKHKHQIKWSSGHYKSANHKSAVAGSATVPDSLNAGGFTGIPDSSLSGKQAVNALHNNPVTTNAAGTTANESPPVNDKKTAAFRGLNPNSINPHNTRNQTASTVTPIKPGLVSGSTPSSANISGNGSANLQGRRIGGSQLNPRPGLIHNSSALNRFGNGAAHLSGRGVGGRQLKPAGHITTNALAKLNRDPAAGGANTPNNITRINNSSVNANGRNDFLMTATSPQLDFNSITTIQHITLPGLSNSLNLRTSGQVQTGKDKKDKPAKVKNSRSSNLDWGILMGVNASGSFTSKNQNANFYGSSPVDLYFGLFASYKLNDTWAINPQIRLFSPQSITTTYSHANQSKVYSTQGLTITASRKVYAVSVPVYVVYNLTNNISLKAGPVINFPVKQVNANSLLQPATIKADSAYYANITGILNKTQYDQKLNFGISGGASFKYKRFIFEATYLKSLSGYGITSGFGSYKSYNGTFQFTIGFQLDKVKPK